MKKAYSPLWRINRKMLELFRKHTYGVDDFLEKQAQLRVIHKRRHSQNSRKV